jgi:Uncharacterized membrane protein, required for colicin V production
MNYFDIFFVLIIVWSGIRGFSTGFVIQISGLLAIILGTFIAYKTSYWVASKISGAIVADPIILNSIAFIITFFVVWGLIVLFGKFLHAIIKIAMLGLLNRIFGVVFAIVKVAFALSVILMLVGNINNSFNFLSQEQINKSALYKPIEKFAPAIFPYLKTGFNEAQQRWDANQ